MMRTAMICVAILGVASVASADVAKPRETETITISWQGRQMTLPRKHALWCKLRRLIALCESPSASVRPAGCVPVSKPAAGSQSPQPEAKPPPTPTPPPTPPPTPTPPPITPPPPTVSAAADRSAGAPVAPLVVEPGNPLARLVNSIGTTATALLALLAVVLLMLVVTLIWTKLIVPRRRRRPLIEAIRLLNDASQDSPESLKKIEDQLSAAMVAGLSPADVADAQFARSYVRARRGNLDGAAADIEDVRRGDPDDAEAAYLDLWLRSRRNKVDAVLAMHGDPADSARVRDMLDARLAFGIAALQRGVELFRQRELRQAIRYFQILRDLKVLTEHIPAQIERHEVVLATQALFKKDLADARKYFAAAVETAHRDNTDAIPGQIGLLLCDWQDSKKRPQLHGAVSALADKLFAAAAQHSDKLFHSHCNDCLAECVVAERHAGEKLRCPSCGEKFEVVLEGEYDAASAAQAASASGAASAASAADATAPEDDDSDLARPAAALPRVLDDGDLMLRNLLLWRLVALLESWRARDPQPGVSPEDLAAVRRCAEDIHRVDAALPDATLIEGLLRYYFAASPADRDAAFVEIRRATERGVSHPAILDLVGRHAALAKRVAEARNAMTDVVRAYLMDPHIDLEVRKRVLAKLRGRRGVSQLPVELPDKPSGPPPTAQELLMRSAHLQRRINDYLALTEHGDKRSDRITSSMTVMKNQADLLKRASDGYAEAEQRVVSFVVQDAFPDEEALHPPPKPGLPIGKPIPPLVPTKSTVPRPTAKPAPGVR